jgi:hypothetical protein
MAVVGDVGLAALAVDLVVDNLVGLTGELLEAIFQAYCGRTSGLFRLFLRQYIYIIKRKNCKELEKGN